MRLSDVSAARLFFMISLFAFLFGCAQKSQPKVGDLCTVNDGEGFYRVAKVLVIDDVGVHIRLYKNKWKERPQSVETNLLSLGSVNDKDGFGMGHLPLTKRAFNAYQPIVLCHQEVTKDELDGYDLWKEEKGGYFGDK